MIIPMPTMPEQVGRPSDYAMSKRPYLFTLIILQLVIFVLRFQMLGDTFGALIMIIIAFMGWSALRDNMNVQIICTFGWMCALNGSFASIGLLDRAAKEPDPIFSEKASFMDNAHGVVQVAIPLVHLPGAVLSYYLYQHFASSDLSGQTIGYESGAAGRPTWTSPVMLFVLFLHTVNAALTFVACGDPQSGFWLSVTAALGWGVWGSQYPRNMVLMWAWLSGLGGLFTAILVIHYMATVPEPIFSSSYPLADNLCAVTFPGTPLLLFPTVIFAVYLAITAPPDEESALPEVLSDLHERTSLLSSSQSPLMFRPFIGTGQKLGDNI